MDWKKMFDENENPLDNLANDGGFCGIFRTIGCIGDSLSSGEFESLDENGKKGNHDRYDYSWGQYIARQTGSRVYNFSRGGMTAKGYHTFANLNGFWWKEQNDATNVCQANIIALGVNDVTSILSGDTEFGDISDIDLENYNNNKDTFIGSYAKIIQRLREAEARCPIFLMTMPHDESDAEREKLYDKHAEFLHKLSHMFDLVYVLDFRKYAPVYDKGFKEKFYLGDHMNPMGYMLTAKMVMSYIDYIIRHNMADFKQAGFIGTPYKNLSDTNTKG